MRGRWAKDRTSCHMLLFVYGGWVAYLLLQSRWTTPLSLLRDKEDNFVSPSWTSAHCACAKNDTHVRTHHMGSTTKECLVCLERISEDEFATGVYPCHGVVMHRQCAIRWRNRGDYGCPLCRTSPLYDNVWEFLAAQVQKCMNACSEPPSEAYYYVGHPVYFVYQTPPPLSVSPSSSSFTSYQSSP